MMVKSRKVAHGPAKDEPRLGIPFPDAMLRELPTLIRRYACAQPAADQRDLEAVAKLFAAARGKPSETIILDARVRSWEWLLAKHALHFSPDFARLLTLALTDYEEQQEREQRARERREREAGWAAERRALEEREAAGQV